MSWQNEKKRAYYLIDQLKNKGVDIDIVLRSTVYEYNKGIKVENFERYYKTWEDLADALYMFLLGLNYKN